MQTNDIRPRLSAAAVRFDRNQARSKHYNKSALALYLARVEQVQDDVSQGISLRTAICKRFNDRLRDHMLGAVGLPRWDAQTDVG